MVCQRQDKHLKTTVERLSVGGCVWLGLRKVADDVLAMLDWHVAIDWKMGQQQDADSKTSE